MGYVNTPAFSNRVMALQADHQPVLLDGIGFLETAGAIANIAGTAAQIGAAGAGLYFARKDAKSAKEEAAKQQALAAKDAKRAQAAAAAADAQAKQEKAVADAVAAASASTNLTPWLVGGGVVLLAGAAAVIYLMRRRKAR